VFEYHAAGFAAVSIEDQVFPKRCAYGKGMRVVPRRDAMARLAAALSARDEIRAHGGDILVIARTDSRLATNAEMSGDNFKEAILRCFEFRTLGADAVWMEVSLF
jgi:2-methylisocitrate lyase-like PEP mutase family enzyme